MSRIMRQICMGDCLKGKMIFELLILVSMKNTVLMDLMLIAWSVIPTFQMNLLSVCALELSVVAMEVKTLPESSFHVNAFHRAGCLKSF